MRPFVPLVSLLFPSKCIFCREPLTAKSQVATCPSCDAALPAHQNRRAFPLPFVDGTVRPPFCYRGIVRSAFMRFKFYHRPGYAKAFASYLLAAVDPQALKDIDGIAFVPSGFVTYYKRGYNQSHLLARELARSTRLPLCSLLWKRPFVRTQSLTKAEERPKNVRGAFVPKRSAARAKGKSLLLIDDVVTSGATLSEAAKALKGAGVLTVYAAALATSVPGGPMPGSHENQTHIS